MFNVITPLSRYNNLDKLINMLKPHNIKWHIITDSDSIEKIELNESWIQHYVCPNKEKEFFERCNFSINWFIKNYDIKDEEMYCFLNDDDAYEENFFSKIKKELEKENSDVIICSMERGHNIPEEAIPVRRHPPTKLWALPGHVGLNMTGIEQIILKGKILKQHRLPLLSNGDGLFIMDILNKNKNTYATNVNVLFNYFEPGRWNNV